MTDTSLFRLKSKLANRELTVGSWLSLGSCDVAEIMTRSGGYDWIVVDMEHTAIGTSIMADLIRVVHLAGAVPLVRVGGNDPLLIKRALDCGAGGIIVPNVSSVAEAEAAVAAAYYPPKGTRGVGLSRAQGYGLDFDEYRDNADDVVVVVQIEHKDGVANLDEILAVSGVDAFIIGPYDLSGSFGKPGCFDDPEVATALATVVEKMKTSQVPGGIHIVHPDGAVLRQRIDEGYRFIAYGVDQLFLATTVSDQAAVVSEVKKTS